MKEIRDINFEHPAVGTVTISNFKSLILNGQIGCFMHRNMLTVLCAHLLRVCSEEALRVFAHSWSKEIMGRWNSHHRADYFGNFIDGDFLREELVNRLKGDCGSVRLNPDWVRDYWPEQYFGDVNARDPAFIRHTKYYNVKERPLYFLDEKVWVFMMLTGGGATYARATSKEHFLDEDVEYIAFPEHPDFSLDWISCEDSWFYYDWPSIPEVQDKKLFQTKIAEAEQRAEIGAL